MNPMHSHSLALAAGIAALVVSSSAAALAQRTFVASYGSDANPCSVTSPCRSFAVAIANTNSSGEVVVLDSAGYGTVTITQSVTIDAPPGIYAGISVPSGATGVTVNANGELVSLRGLSINGQGGNVGIDFQLGDRLTVERCTVSNLANRGLWLRASSSMAFVSDSTFRYNSPGVEVNSGTVTLDRVRLENNGSSGLLVAPAPFDTAVAIVRDTLASSNVGVGFQANSASGTTARLSANRTSSFANGGYGFRAVGAGTTTVIVSDSSATENLLGGVGSFSAGATTVVTNSAVSRNGGFGFEQSAGASLVSLHNNTVEENVAGATSGTITAATLK